MEHTTLKIYSIGYVAEDMVEDGKYVKIYPIEIISDHTGLTNQENLLNYSIKDSSGNIDNVIVNKSVTIKAKWMNFGNSNRATAPNVRVGEMVLLFKYGHDQYRWISLENEIDLRTNEKAMYIYSNKKTITDKSKLNSVYYTLMDTINKKVILHTDDTDGEYTSYDFTINTKDGTFTINDGFSNYVEIDSRAKSITTHMHSSINMDAPNINATCNNANIATGKLKIHNSTAELVQTMSDLVEAIIGESHVGNKNIPTHLTAGSVAKFTAIKEKIDSFI